jgi:hypothetical protein
MHKAIVILGEDVWQIDVNVGSFDTEEKARSVAEGNCNFIFASKGGKAALMGRIGGEVKLFFDEDVDITEISKEKQDVMGEPLDISIEGNKEKAIEALKNLDPAYVITSDDMVASNKTLIDFIEEYGLGYKPDHIAFGVQKVN